jgi:malate dehydrogenase (oxaloacetate-decarboxylating)
MIDIKFKRDTTTGEVRIETSLKGKALLNTPLLNRGTAFTYEERRAFGLLGKLPMKVETLQEQISRAYQQFLQYQSDYRKNIYLSSTYDINEVLFYSLVQKHLTEMMPIIYTPIVGTAVQTYSREFRQPRGLYVAYPDIDKIDEILANRTHPNIDLVVVSDGGGVLGIGDQGVGGIDIPIAKLKVYTLCGGVNPAHCLPILLDVGTDNQTLLNDPMYLGWRNPRIQGKAYDDFIAAFVAGIQRAFPKVFLHWEDFNRDSGRRNLESYQDKLCTFNDDIQGTGAVALAGVKAAIAATDSTIQAQRIVIFGAGSAGVGIADQIYADMLRQGLSPEAAAAQFWLIDREGLLTTDSTSLLPFQRRYARAALETTDWQRTASGGSDLAETVRQVHPTILIGTSAVSGAFTEAIIRDMAAHVSHPIILPLSNPTERVEAVPIDLLQWTDGRALIATGSPFADVSWQAKPRVIAQCNNALVFPGIGLGILAIKAARLTDDMLAAAVDALTALSPARQDKTLPVLPGLEQSHVISRQVALAVIKAARAAGLDTEGQGQTAEVLVDNLFWQPKYLPLWCVD